MPGTQVLIVGAGVTGSLLAMLLKQAGISVRVLEKSNGAGGRMSTHSFRGLHAARDAPVLGRGDLGAQYITTRSHVGHPELSPLYQRLLSAGVLQPFDGKVTGPNPYGDAGTEIRHFMAPEGLQAIARHFLAAGDVSPSWGHSVTAISLDGSGRLQLKMGCKGQSEDVEETIDGPCVVVLTQPVPQVLGESKHPLRGNFLEHVEPAVLADLQKVQFSSRFAAVYYFDSKAFKWPFDYTARYFDGGDVRYVCHDSGKRCATGEQVVSIVVHSAVPLGMEFLDEEEPFLKAADRLQEDLVAKLPEIPWRQAASVKVHKWRYSQVYKGFGGRRPIPDWVWGKDSTVDSAPGYVTLARTGLATILVSGDAAAPSSNFEGCAFSAIRTAAAVRSFLEAPR